MKTMPTFFEAMVSMPVTIQTLHLILAVSDWFILKRGSVNVKTVVRVQHV